VSVAPVTGDIAPATEHGITVPEAAIRPSHTHPHLSPIEMEDAARRALNGWINLRVDVRAPTWRELIFGGRPADITIPRVPEACLALLDKTPQVMPGDGPAAAGAKLLEALRSARPRGGSPRSLSARRPLPPSRDALSAWMRRVFLIAAGPEVTRLLAAGGYLIPGDVAMLEAAYPKSIDAERMACVEAATAFTVAAMRNGHHEAELPAWLNAQLLTLMAEHRPAEFFQSLYSPAAAPAPDQPGPSASGQPSVIAQQMNPNPSPNVR
jgi:hypothetical protein